MNNRYLFTATLLACLAAVTPAWVHADSPTNTALYYELGSSEVSVGPLNPVGFTRFSTLPGDFALPTLCDIWDNRHNLEDLFGGLVDFYLKQELAFDGLTEQIITGIKTAPEVLLIAALQRALPGFYDFSQNLKAQIDFKVNNAELSCQKAVDKMEGGTNPLDGWIQVAVSGAWRDTLSDGYSPTNGNHILGAEQDVLENARKKGIHWFGGRRGHENDKPIRVVEDIVSAGYAVAAMTDSTVTTEATYNGSTAISAPGNVSVQRLNADGTQMVSTAQKPRLSELWASSTAARNFAIEVLGEEHIVFCAQASCVSRFSAGQGLGPTYEREFVKVADAWADLMKDFDGVTKRPPLGRYAAVSSRRIQMSNVVFDAIKAQTGANRVILIEKLASDIAADRTIDMALGLRQLLRAGANKPEVSGLEFATSKARKLSDDIKAEVEDLRWEIAQQRSGAGTTVSSIIAAHELNRITRANGETGTRQISGGTRIEQDRIVDR